MRLALDLEARREVLARAQPELLERQLRAIDLAPSGSTAHSLWEKVMRMRSTNLQQVRCEIEGIEAMMASILEYAAFLDECCVANMPDDALDRIDRELQNRSLMMKVNEIMTKDPACCTSETKLEDVARLMVESDCGCIPVVDASGVPIGVITDRDIVCRSVAKGWNPLELTAGDCMSTPCAMVDENASVEDCCEILEGNQIRRVVVVDGGGRLLRDRGAGGHRGESE